MPLKSLPLPDDPVLAAWGSALNEAGYRRTCSTVGGGGRSNRRVAGELRGLGRGNSRPYWGRTSSARSACRFPTGRIGGRGACGGFVADGTRHRSLCLACTPGGRDELRGLVDPELSDLVDELQPTWSPRVVGRPEWAADGGGVTGSSVWFRLDDRNGNFAGFSAVSKPAAGMSRFSAAAAAADLAHLERIRLVPRPDRRPAAILMANMEASSPLAATSFDRAVFRVRSPTRTRGGPMHPRRRKRRRSSRRRWHRRLLPYRNGGIRILGREIVYCRGPGCAMRSPTSRRAASILNPISRYGSAFTGERRCTSEGSSPLAAAKSPRSETSERGRKDRSLRHRRKNTCLQGAHRTAQPR